MPHFLRLQGNYPLQAHVDQERDVQGGDLEGALLGTGDYTGDPDVDTAAGRRSGTLSQRQTGQQEVERMSSRKKSLSLSNRR